jgi:hypothetical protein
MYKMYKIFIMYDFGKLILRVDNYPGDLKLMYYLNTPKY